MHSHIRAEFIIAAAASLMSSAALAQTAQPNGGPATNTVTHDDIHRHCDELDDPRGCGSMADVKDDRAQCL
jgi:hypothetical protein